MLRLACGEWAEGTSTSGFDSDCGDPGSGEAFARHPIIFVFPFGMVSVIWCGRMGIVCWEPERLLKILLTMARRFPLSATWYFYARMRDGLGG